ISQPVVVQEPAAVSVAPSEPSKPAEAEPVSAAPADIAPVAAPAESKPRAPRRRAPQAVPDDQIASSGMVMVETSPDKIKAVVEDAVASAPERTPRPRRAPRPKIVEESAPLVQVETQHK
ncbi:MAG: Rne/Rng family ribonuclease, partial [Sulfuricella sp.]